MRTLAWATLALLTLGAAQAEAPADLKRWTGGATPSLAAPDLQGRTVDLKSLRGRVVIVNFWATWCDPCKEEMPSLQRLREKLAGRPVEVLAVNYGEFRDKVAPFVARSSLSLPVLLDTHKEIARDWKVGGLPMTFIVDAAGKVRYSVYGERDWADEGTVRLVDALVEEGARARR